MTKVFDATKALKFTLALAVILCLVGYMVDGILLPYRGWYASDFSWYYYGAKVAAGGGNIYDNEELRETARAAGEPEEFLKLEFLFTYPPFFAILMRPLLLFSHARARIFWLFLNNGLYILAVILCIAALRERVSFFEATAMAFAALNFNPVFRNLFMGQINVVTFLLLAAALYAFKRKAEGPAGALLGLATMIKVSPALFVLYFLFKRRWRVVIWAVLAVIFLLVITVVIVGIKPNRTYMLEVIPEMVRWKEPENNHSLAGFFNRLFGYGFGGESFFHNVTFARMFTSVAAFSFFFLSFLIVGPATQDDHLRWNLGLSLFALTANIISPITWENHLVWLMLPIITLIHFLFARSEHHSNRGSYVFLFLITYIILAWKFDFFNPALRSRGLMIFASIKLYAMILMWGLLGLTIRNLRKKEPLQRSVTMKNRPWPLLIVSLGAIVFGLVVIRPGFRGFIGYLQTTLEGNIWFWHELAVRLVAALFLSVGALGILGLRKWGVILLWLSAFVLGTYWSGASYHWEALRVLALHLPLLTVPLFYWKRLTWKI